MNAEDKKDTELSPLKRAYLALDKMQAKLERLEQRRREPIALVGIGCRFPGHANDPHALWQLLQQGRYAVADMPPGRFDVAELDRLSELTRPSSQLRRGGSAAGLSMTREELTGLASRLRRGGFVDDVDGFDPSFFHLSAGEAAAMDPQQRLLLEVAWEALEDAGLPAEAIAGSRTGVYVGFMDSDYLLLTYSDPNNIGRHTFHGTEHGVLANRISYTFDLRGPSVALDAACPSGLIGIQLACQSLRSGDTDLSIVGAVSLNLLPLALVGLSHMVRLAPDGRHKAFDASADGIVPSEGCGAVVLKRLSDAERDGDRVYAVLHGVEVAQLGRTNGLNTPSAPMLRQVMARAVEQSGLVPAQITYVEGHGAATGLGDQMELEALASVFGTGRPDGRLCAVGSVKTNLGHTKGACSIAAVIKTALCLYHRTIAPIVHLTTPNASVNLTGKSLSFPVRAEPWDTGGEPRYAAVQVYGTGGTLSAAVLGEAAKAEPASEAEAGRPYLLPLSAHDPKTLQALLGAYEDYLADADRGGHSSLRDICYHVAVRRSHHSHRIAVPGSTHQEMLRAVRELRRGWQTGTASFIEKMARTSPRLVYLFTGHAGSWPAASLSFLEEYPIFKATLDECDRALKRHLNISIRSQKTHATDLEAGRPDPWSFAVQTALAALFRSLGLSPDAVAGCGGGEVAAALVSGTLSLETAAGLVCGEPSHLALAPASSICLLSSRDGRPLAAEPMNSPRFRQQARTRREAMVRALEREGHASFLALDPSDASVVKDESCV